jgi:hypothetical protein
MDYRRLFEAIRDYTGMYLFGRSYLEVVAFVAGVDAGNASCFLIGFPEWLVVTRGAPTNLSWDGMVVHIAFPEEPQCWDSRKLSDEQQKHAIDVLVALLLEFMTERDRRGGMEAIFTAFTKVIREREEQWEREAQEEQETTEEQRGRPT